MKPIVIFGIGELAEVAAFYFEHDSPRVVAAFTVDAGYLRESTFSGLPVVPFEELADTLPPSAYDLFVAVGYSGLNDLRASKCAAGRSAGYALAMYVSSRATTWPGLVTGDNAFILEDNTIQPFARIGNNVVLWSGNHVGHHAVIEDNVFVTSQVVISGGVTIGENTFLGVNSTIRDHGRIGRRCVIGAGAVITEDAEDGSVYIPAPSSKSRVPSSRLRHL